MTKKIQFTMNKTWLSLKSVVRNKATFLMMILFPFLSMVPIVFFFPFWAAAAYVIQINVILTTSMIYANINFNFKKSILRSNEKLVISNRTPLYMSTIIVIFIFVSLSSLLQLGLLFFLNHFHLLLGDWVFGNPATRWYDLTYLKFGAWFWSIYWTMLLTFSIFFLFRNLIETEKNHYVFTLAMIIIAFIWGGSLNDYYGGGITQFGDEYEKTIKLGLFPDAFYWPTLILFPFFAPGQLASVNADFTILSDGHLFISNELYTHSLIHLSFNPLYIDRAAWNATIMMPFIHFGIFTTIGLLISTKQ